MWDSTMMRWSKVGPDSFHAVSSAVNVESIDRV